VKLGQQMKWQNLRLSLGPRNRPIFRKANLHRISPLKQVEMVKCDQSKVEIPRAVNVDDGGDAAVGAVDAAMDVIAGLNVVLTNALTNGPISVSRVRQPRVRHLARNRVEASSSARLPDTSRSCCLESRSRNTAINSQPRWSRVRKDR